MAKPRKSIRGGSSSKSGILRENTASPLFPLPLRSAPGFSPEFSTPNSHPNRDGVSSTGWPKRFASASVTLLLGNVVRHACRFVYLMRSTIRHKASPRQRLACSGSVPTGPSPNMARSACLWLKGMLLGASCTIWKCGISRGQYRLPAPVPAPESATPNTLPNRDGVSSTGRPNASHQRRSPCCSGTSPAMPAGSCIPSARPSGTGFLPPPPKRVPLARAPYRNGTSIRSTEMGRRPARAASARPAALHHGCLDTRNGVLTEVRPGAPVTPLQRIAVADRSRSASGHGENASRATSAVPASTIGGGPPGRP